MLLLITTFRSEQVSKHAFLQSLLEQANGKEVCGGPLGSTDGGGNRPADQPASGNGDAGRTGVRGSESRKRRKAIRFWWNNSRGGP